MVFLFQQFHQLLKDICGSWDKQLIDREINIGDKVIRLVNLHTVDPRFDPGILVRSDRRDNRCISISDQIPLFRIRADDITNRSDHLRRNLLIINDLPI